MDFNKIMDSIKEFFSDLVERLKRTNWEKYKVDYNPDNEYQNFAIIIITSLIFLICLKGSISFFKAHQVGIGVVLLLLAGIFGAYIYKFFKTHFLK